MMLGGPGKRCVVLMNQSSRDHTLLDVRPSPEPGRGAVSFQSSRDKHQKRSLPGSTVRKEGRAISTNQIPDAGPLGLSAPSPASAGLRADTGELRAGTADRTVAVRAAAGAGPDVGLDAQ